MIIVHQATEADLPTLVQFGADFLKTYRCGPWHPGMLPKLGSLLIANHIALLGEVDGKPAGMLLALWTTSMFDPIAKMVQEVAWWVDPQFRESGVGVELLTAFEDIVGDTPAMLCTLPTSPVEQAWFEKRGWRVQQTTFARNF